MTKYWFNFVISLKGFFAYKADFALSIAFNMVFFFIFMYVWRTVYSANGGSDIANYSLSNTITYYLITSLIFRIALENSVFLGNNIWYGDLTNQLIKPWNVVWAEITDTLCDVTVSLIIYIPFFAFMLLVAGQYISVPNLLYFVCFIVTLILAFGINLWINFSVHTLTFYFGDQEPNVGLINYVIAFFAGGFFPLAFLATKFAWFNYLPFRFLFDVPANIYLQKLNFNQILSSWGQMLIWIVVFYLIFYFLYKFGIKKYTGTGR